MIASDLNASFSIQGSYTLTGSGTISANRDTMSVGSNNFDAISISWTYGTGSQQAKQTYAAERTVNATTADNLDLAGGLTNGIGETITFTTLKFFLVVIDAPNGTKAMRVGPRGVSNAWVGPFESADAYLDTKELLCWVSSYSTGYAVTADTADIFALYNPSAGSLSYRIWLMGNTA